ncbi:unnamed protein product, partial [Echinostoma caproni]|uniref:SSD domain-containing protein n=1 Tax=Echinostoma caproni TaxID=27848 RepID=A0A183AP11_9TREM
EIFPYLVALIGFENVIILTKSVVATPIDLPVKYRIAQGLSKESWPLTKHYVTQFVLLGLGFFTFHPTMQEFCLFAVVGVTTDFFLQLFFFVSVLSIDIRRMEFCNFSKAHVSSSNFLAHPEAEFNVEVILLAAEAAAFLASDERPTENFPRRLRILRMWAKHRLIQRFIVVFMSLWLAIFLIYAIDISQLLPSALNSLIWPRNVETSLSAIKPPQRHDKSDFDAKYGSDSGGVDSELASTKLTTTSMPQTTTTSTTRRFSPSDLDSYESAQLKSDMLTLFNEFPLAHVLRHPTQATWNQLLLWNYLAFYHWPLLAKHYNLSLAGYHSVLLEPVHLQYRIEVESMPNADNPSGNPLYSTRDSDEAGKISYWKWQPYSSFLLSDIWSPDKYWYQSSDPSVNKSESESNPLLTFTEDLMHLFRQSKRGSATDVSPGGLAGWTSRLSLTASMLGTTVLCCSLVLMATCLGMIFFQELQAKFSNDALSVRRLAASFLRRSSRRRSTVWSMTFISDGRLVVGCSDAMVEVSCAVYILGIRILDV